jgi:predicted phosphodiesterase
VSGSGATVAKVDAIRLVAVSDTHLSSRAPEGLANWAAVVRDVAATNADLIVHLGDVTLDGAGGTRQP